jgi:hypothetical protein
MSALCNLREVYCVQLLEDPEVKLDAKRKRKEVLQQHRFAETFGAKSGQRQKKPKLAVEDYEGLVAAASDKQEDYGAKNEGTVDAYALKHERHFATVCLRADLLIVESKLYPAKCGHFLSVVFLSVLFACSALSTVRYHSRANVTHAVDYL